MEKIDTTYFTDLNSDSNYVSEKIIEEIEKNGYVLLRGVNFEITEDGKHKKSLMDFCKLIGTPMLHNAMPDSYVWDIKPVKNSKSTFVTHSELALEAELHTDSAFSENPEDYFCLYSIKKAKCNGGESILLPLEDLLIELRKTEAGIKAEDQFRTKKFPFAVPSVFKEGHASQNENLYVMDYILSGDTIRYRIDVIQKCLNIEPDLIDEDQYEALRTIQIILQKSLKIQRLMLEVGDLIILSNKKMLHGREAFRDHDRHLLRIRIRSKVQIAKELC